MTVLVPAETAAVGTGLAPGNHAVARSAAEARR